jgi:hypothetical protein
VLLGVLMGIWNGLWIWDLGFGIWNLCRLVLGWDVYVFYVCVTVCAQCVY